MAFITNRATGGATTLGKRLGELISHADRLDMLVGFFYFSGVKILADALRNRPELGEGMPEFTIDDITQEELD